MENIGHTISRFIDNELDEKSQSELFEQLKNDSNARDTLRSFIKMEKEASSFYSSKFPPVCIVNSKSKDASTDSNKLIFSLFKYAAILLLFISSLFFLYKMNLYSHELQMASTTMEKQTETIKILMNSLPPVKVTPNGSELIVRTNL